MTASDKIKMTINIGGERFILEVPFENQLIVRDAEKMVNTLINENRMKNPSRTADAIMARIAYSLAEKNIVLENMNAEAMALAQKCSEKISGLTVVE